MFCWGESGSILGSVARIWFAHPGKGSYSSTCCCDELKSSKRKHAVVAQLVEHHLAKVDVASSSLVNRSTKAPRFASGLFRCLWVLLPPGFYCLWVFSFWRCGRGSCDLSRGCCLGGVAARLLWLPDDLTVWSSDCPVIWLSGGGAGKIFKKIWDAKRAGERVKLLSEPPQSCFEG